MTGPAVRRMRPLFTLVCVLKLPGQLSDTLSSPSLISPIQASFL